MSRTSAIHDLRTLLLSFHPVIVTEGFSGAEIEQVVVSALYRALYENQRLDEALLEEIAGTVPLSVSRREDIERLRESARGRFVSVR